MRAVNPFVAIRVRFAKTRKAVAQGKNPRPPKHGDATVSAGLKANERGSARGGGTRHLHQAA